MDSQAQTTVDAELELSNPNGGTVCIYRCKCTCGGVFHATKEDVDSGEVKSCGHERARRDQNYFIPLLSPHNRRLFIQGRAYFLWMEAGQPAGNGSEFWLAAEKQIKAEYPSK